MKMYRISNPTPMSIIIEDLGIRLQPAGGNGSHVSVRADLAGRSLDLKNSKWLIVEEFDVVPNSLATTIPSVPIQPSASIPLPSPVPVPEMSAPADISELEHLRKSIDDMRIRQEVLLEFLRSTSGVRTDDRAKTRDQNFGKAEDPVILLGKITPDSVEVSVIAREDELSGESFDYTVEALRKVKRK